ncbi:NTP transferase domain-containing protein [Paenibacillus lycopersici]|uniref:Glucose-1-phosphate thymidylyltransferase n=1 Tax=Paenibacillus lycopersici TaxID=2704462 RepID=A0A6C0FWC2_9BACL|nr:sugar phosphate nucleotidyltransferase [Paenibacillus lycopersici]QHT59269.1 NTP transferase domain-containing protein [Paenibacillus lycopersici]
MKGIILAGGTGSRLLPLTKVTNKHLLPVGRYPMIYHAIAKLKSVGITDILIVTGKDHMGDVVGLLGSGSKFAVSFTYKVQDEAGGIAQALGLAERFVGADQMVVILGDNVFSHDISGYVNSFRVERQSAKILLQRVPDPNRYGVALLKGDVIAEIVEKPTQFISDYAVTGIYMFDSSVFDIIRTLKPSRRGELEITDVNNHYIENQALKFDILPGWWTDAGTIQSLGVANELAKDIILGEEFEG